jgi:uridine phosphorylase
VGELAQDQIEVALHRVAEVEDVASGDLQVDVGVGGEVIGPGGVPRAGPDAGQPRRQHPAGADEQVAAGVVEPLQQGDVDDAAVGVLAGDQFAGGQLPVRGGDVQVEA